LTVCILHKRNREYITFAFYIKLYNIFYSFVNLLEMNIYLCLFVFLITETNGLSSYWTRVLPRICSKNTPQSTTNAVMDCDRLMDNEAIDKMINLMKKTQIIHFILD
jgi:hypothetical protein